MGRKKVEESERCQGLYRSGVRCRHRATVGVPPAYCRACDPSPEGRTRVADLARRRHPVGTPEAKARDEARVEGTLDSIVRRALASSAECERASKAAAQKADSLGAARLGQAVAALGRLAVSALKARSTVGDILPAAKPTKGAKSPEVGSDGAGSPPEGGALEDWLPGRVDA